MSIDQSAAQTRASHAIAIKTMTEPNVPTHFICPLDAQYRCLATSTGWRAGELAVVAARAEDQRPRLVKKVLVKPTNPPARLDLISIIFDEYRQGKLDVKDEDGNKRVCVTPEGESWRRRRVINSSASTTRFAIESTRFPKEFLTYSAADNSVQLEPFDYSDGEVQAVPRRFVWVFMDAGGNQVGTDVGNSENNHNHSIEQFVQMIGQGVAGAVQGASLTARVPALLEAVGFTPSGVAAKSLASGIQSLVYGARTRGAFSVCQSIGATGTPSLHIVAVAGVVGGAIGVLTSRGAEFGEDSPRDSEGSTGDGEASQDDSQAPQTIDVDFGDFESTYTVEELGVEEVDEDKAETGGTQLHKT